MISLNTRSMREKVPEIMTFLQNSQVDIALIQETWIRKCDTNVLKQIKEYGYQIVSFRKPLSLEWGGGVAFIHRNLLKVNQVKSDFTFKTFEHVTCKVFAERSTLILVSLYRRGYSTTNKFSVDDFLEEFQILLDDLCDSSTPILICGDFNIHVELIGEESLSLSSSKAVKQKDAINFLKKLEENSLKQGVIGSTHNLGGTLSLAVTSAMYPIYNEISIGLENEICFSDHYHLEMDIPYKCVTLSDKVTLFRRNLDNLDGSFTENLKSIDLLEIVSSNEVNDVVLNYNTFLMNTFDSYCPLKKLVLNPHKKQKWFNSSLRETKRIVRQAERKYKKYPNLENQYELKNIRNLYSSSIKQTRSAYFANICDRNENDTSMLYRTVKYYLDDDSCRLLPTCENDETLANVFTNFFLQKIVKIREDIDNDSSIDISLRSTHHTPYIGSNQFSSFNLLAQDDIVRLVNEMACKLNNDDPILLSYLKQHVSYFAPALEYIVNMSLQSGVFPDLLKHGNVSPIIKSKSADKEIHSNFRPVTTLPFLSKLLEKAASTQLLSYLESNDLIPQYQSAYLKGHSCETALFHFTNEVQQMLSKGQVVLLVQLDLSAAFDTVDHAVLLQLLQHKFGFTGIALKWFKSYLSGRTFSVKIGYVKGRRVLLIYGVPQGSVLGPLLFIIYISDLPAIASSYDVLFQSYADDSHLYAAFDPLVNLSETKARMKACVNKFELWMKSNYLKMNVGKTEVLFIAKPQDHALFSNMSISIGDKCYVSSSEHCIESLGSHISSTLHVNPTVSEVVKSCSYNLKRLSPFRYMLSVKHKLLLVKSFILNKVDYCSILLVNAPKGQVARLQRVLNKAIRFVYSLKQRDSVTYYLKDAHILPMESRIAYKSCTFVYKMLHENCPHYMKDVIFKKPPQQRNLRSNSDNLLYLQNTHQSTLQYGMIKNWNCLPYEIRSVTTIDTFKTQLKTYYFNLSYA